MTEKMYQMKHAEMTGNHPYAEVVKEKFSLALALMRKTDVTMNGAQRLGLLSHLCAMVSRHFEGGEIPPVDKAMFSEVSAWSIRVAEQICEGLSQLVEGEKYLLSIHFEAAKLNPV